MEITAIILAGGLSSRMGTDKGVIQLDEKKMIEKVITNLTPFCDTILISANNNNYNYLGHKIIKDKYGRIGPVGGILSCLEESKTTANLVMSCDTPNISATVIKQLLIKTENYDTILPYHHNRFDPLTAYYNKSCIPILKEMINNKEYKLQHIIKNLNYKKVYFKDEDETLKEFININDKNDLKRYYEN